MIEPVQIGSPGVERMLRYMAGAVIFLYVWLPCPMDIFIGLLTASAKWLRTDEDWLTANWPFATFAEKTRNMAAKRVNLAFIS